jgi:hypothetical protein
LLLKWAATIITIIVITVGIAITSPLFIRPNTTEAKQVVMLCFDVNQTPHASEWCINLSRILDQNNLPATVFFSGKMAEQNPKNIFCFSENVDIGSKTDNCHDFSEINDYSLKLKQIQHAKTALEQAGNIEISTFRTHLEFEDPDIYSLLNRSGILADFSYIDHYNIYKNGYFIRYEAKVYDAKNYGAEFFLGISKSDTPLIICLDNTLPIVVVEAFLVELKKGDFMFVNASGLAGFDLTVRNA